MVGKVSWWETREPRAKGGALGGIVGHDDMSRVCPRTSVRIIPYLVPVSQVRKEISEVLFFPLDQLPPSQWNVEQSARAAFFFFLFVIRYT